MINEGEPVTPRPSATVLLMRGNKPWEILLMRRPSGADFMPNAFVFPGGTVHSDDGSAADEIKAAAVRELFEEMGVLLARKGEGFASDDDAARVRALMAGGTGFRAALEAADLQPAYDQLVYLARWVTPLQVRRRFDTRFFLATMPAGQSIVPQDDEVAEWRWISPEDALVSKEVNLVYATRSVLETVATSESASEVIARVRAQGDVPIVQPKLVQTASGGWEISH